MRKGNGWLAIFGLFLATLVVSAGCGDRNPAGSRGSGTVNVSVRMPESSARLLAQPASSRAARGVVGIRVSLKNAAGNTFVLDVPVDIGRASAAVEAGEWDLQVEVRTDDGRTFTGSARVGVEAGQTRDVTIPVEVNRPPVVHMWADNAALQPGESTGIHVRATDADGDSLHLSCQGPDFVWTAPSTAGNYKVFCRVDDGHGGVVEEFVTIHVNTLPVITGMTPANGTTFSVTLAVGVAATDADGDPLTYEWSVTNGTYSGGGSSIVVTGTCAPTCPVTVTVTVKDNRGGSASATRTYFLI